MISPVTTGIFWVGRKGLVSETWNFFTASRATTSPVWQNIVVANLAGKPLQIQAAWAYSVIVIALLNPTPVILENPRMIKGQRG